LARFVRLPRVRDDLRALPGLFRSRRLLWLPFILLVVAVLALLIEVSDASLRVALTYFGGFMLGPAALAPAFLAGFLAPRAAYLIGGLVGLLNGVLTMALVGLAASRVPEALAVPADASIGIVAYCTVLGIAFGAFAAWYRRFLQSSTARRRAAAEARARSQRRESRRQPRQATR
jgi:hypothetical protein